MCALMKSMWRLNVFASVTMIPVGAAIIVITRGNAEMSSEFLPGHISDVYYPCSTFRKELDEDSVEASGN